MKQLSLLFLILLITFAAASPLAPLESYALEQIKEYRWVSDMKRWLFDAIIILITSPFFFLASFFANCQECYVSYVTGFMNAKLLRLSYKYV
jgi:hypothetical protein